MAEQSDALALAEILADMGDRLAIQGVDDHRVRAYRRAAESLRALMTPLRELQERGELDEIAGIGDIFAAKIDEYLRTGKLESHQKLRDHVPDGVVAMLSVPGVGPRRAQRFWQDLNITSLAELASAAEAGLLRQLKGIGRETERTILIGARAIQAGQSPQS